MEALLLSVHVVAGILFVGPVAVSASLFPRYAPEAGQVAQVLHRITRVYGLLAVIVPVVGLALAFAQGRTTEVWVLVAMLLTAVAGGLLAWQITPRQRDALATPGSAAGLRQLGMLTGAFNLLWVVVVVLMIVRPGSSYA
ncbi:hypothetical protein H7J08_13455 [Mycobacterium frederiksbergense]|uniref:DUF2269 domain-containing protein n=1 Tax=Mycolicibacterium frederiksbergense TaxID=117567 RepID=A0A6H0S4K4_9MYCO|nr:hypothetical protein [Mycolicibacterium frederiksbergense]MCV7045666.1 hypothetical protein [Mycolicibacterium frederiksbergense]QIV82164.1 hypothetical protein EXE63_15730 [Mycolicibacterium frederiksbergense]